MAFISSIDSILRDVRVVASFSVLTLLLLVGCSGGSSGEGNLLETSGTIVPEVDQRVVPNTDTRPYNPNGAYAAVLNVCIVRDEDPCTLEILPYIGQEHPNPSVSNIMDRVLVSHDWMGERFEQVLTAMPPESLSLFVPVTAVLIGSEVRPSSYRRSIGRIQLDPKYLWLSNSEKTTIATAPDPREAYGAQMKFDGYSRVVKDGKYAWGSNRFTGTNERKLKDILLPTSRLLFHELAHANDYIQKEIFTSLVQTDTPESARVKNFDNVLYNGIYDEALGISDNASWLFRFAETRFADDPLLDNLVDYTAVDAGAIMATEGKADFYGYLTRREDIATLFDQAMMKRYYGVEEHVGFVDKPEDEENASCDDYIIGWGTTNRAAAPLVSVRSEWVMRKILGDSAAIDDFYLRIGSEGALPIGTAWCRSHDVQTAKGLQRSDGSAPSMKQVRDYERSLFERHAW